MTKLTQKSSMAGYRNSSTARGSLWISSMNSTSPRSRLVRIPMRSPPRSRAGPEVVTILVPISAAMMVAKGLAPLPRGLDADPQPRHHPGLADALVEGPRPEAPDEAVLLVRRGPRPGRGASAPLGRDGAQKTLPRHGRAPRSAR